MKVLKIALIVTLGFGSIACSQLFKDIFNSPTEPSATGDVRSYLGTWEGPTVAPVAQSCGSLQWKVTSQTGGQASGDFSAACADGVSLVGTMTATHGETSIPWAAT